MVILFFIKIYEKKEQLECHEYVSRHIYLSIYLDKHVAQFIGAVEYTDFFSVEG